MLVPHSEKDRYFKTLEDTVALFDIALEHEQYNKIIYKNVNNYLALTDKSEVKQKGLFVVNPVLGNSVDTQVIAKALNAYYIDNIPPEEYISNPDKYGLHIYDYCKSNKIDRKFYVVWNNEIQQQLNRYYFRKNNPYLLKVRKSAYSEKDIPDLIRDIQQSNDGISEESAKKLAFAKLFEGNPQHVNVGEGVELFNTFVEKSFEEYDVNYNYYISQTMKIIDEINNFNQLKLF